MAPFTIFFFNYLGHIPSIQDASRHVNALYYTSLTDTFSVTDSECLTKGSRAGMPGMEKGKTFPQTMAYDSPSRSISISDEAATLRGKNKEAVLDVGRKDEIHVERKIVSPKKKETLSSVTTIKSKEQKIQCESSGQSKQERKSSVFKGKIFCFSDSFPQNTVSGC